MANHTSSSLQQDINSRTTAGGYSRQLSSQAHKETLSDNDEGTGLSLTAEGTNAHFRDVGS